MSFPFVSGLNRSPVSGPPVAKLVAVGAVVVLVSGGSFVSTLSKLIDVGLALISAAPTRKSPDILATDTGFSPAPTCLCSPIPNIALPPNAELFTHNGIGAHNPT